MLLQPPNLEQQLYIRKMLNEDISRREQDIETIKTWFRQQPHLPHKWADSETECILSFLRGCSFSLEKCKKKLEMYFTMRAMVPEILANRDISSPEYEDMLKVTDFGVLPDLTHDSKRVFIAAAIKRDFETVDVVYFCKLLLMIQDVRLKIETFGVTGDVYIIDAELNLKKHFFKISLATVKKFMICIQEAYPTKIKEIHIINITPFVEFIFNALSPFLKEKIKSRLHFHSTLESLYEFVPRSMLPEEYGGGGGKLQTLKAQWIRKLEEFAPWFKEQDNMKSDLSKRPRKLGNYEDLFGLDGSFRKLDID